MAGYGKTGKDEYEKENMWDAVGSCRGIDFGELSGSCKCRR